MRLADIHKHPVVDLSSATTVTHLADVAIDATTQRVLGFTVHKAVDGHDWLAWDRAHAVGADAATVSDTSAFTTVPEGALLLKGSGALGRRVLSAEGVELGTLADVDVDPETGAVLTLILADGATVAAEDLLGVGSYATVIRTPVVPAT